MDTTPMTHRTGAHSLMNTLIEQSQIIIRQGQRLRALREESSDLAETVAHQAWDSFETEVHECTEYGFLFEMAEISVHTFVLSLTSRYEELIEAHVLSLFDTLHQQLASCVGEAAIDTAAISLAGLRKSCKLRRHAEEMITHALRNAHPGMGRVLDILVGRVFRDAASDAQAHENDIATDTRRVRQELQALRAPLCQLMQEETQQLIQSARVMYSEGLHQLVDKLHPCTNTTCPPPATDA